jgi:hypothetical protein
MIAVLVFISFKTISSWECSQYIKYNSAEINYFII